MLSSFGDTATGERTIARATAFLPRVGFVQNMQSVV